MNSCTTHKKLMFVCTWNIKFMDIFENLWSREVSCILLLSCSIVPPSSHLHGSPIGDVIILISPSCRHPQPRPFSVRVSRRWAPLFNLRRVGYSRVLYLQRGTCYKYMWNWSSNHIGFHELILPWLTYLVLPVNTVCIYLSFFFLSKGNLIWRTLFFERIKVNDTICQGFRIR